MGEGSYHQANMVTSAKYLYFLADMQLLLTNRKTLLYFLAYESLFESEIVALFQRLEHQNCRHLRQDGIAQIRH